MSLVDSAESRPSSVRRYALAVAAVSVLVTWAVAGSPLVLGANLKAGNADAAVALLLLIPGLLYYRLDLPGRERISGHLRLIPRAVALACLGAMVVLAGLIIGEVSGWVATVIVWLCLAVPLLGFLLLFARDTRIERARGVNSKSRWRVKRTSEPRVAGHEGTKAPGGSLPAWIDRNQTGTQGEAVRWWQRLGRRASSADAEYDLVLSSDPNLLLSEASAFSLNVPEGKWRGT